MALSLRHALLGVKKMMFVDIDPKSHCLTGGTQKILDKGRVSNTTRDVI